jgi:hypothetical protein
LILRREELGRLAGVDHGAHRIHGEGIREKKRQVDFEVR